MSGLPTNWELSKLSEVAEILQGQSPPSSTYNDEGIGLPFFQGKTEFGDLYPTTRKYCSEPNKIAEPDDVLISVRAPVGPTNLAREKSCIGRGLAAIRPLGDAPARYFLYYLRSIEQELASKGTGTTFQAISGKILRETKIPFAPLPEQRRIVARIEELFSRLDAGVAALRQAKAQLQRYRQSVLSAAVTGQLTQEWREQNPKTEPAEELLKRILKQRRAQWDGRGKYKEPVALELSDEDPKPATWTTTNLDSATTILGDGLHGTPEYDPEGEFYFINGNNLSNGRIIFKDSTKRVSESEYRKHSKPLTENSIFVSINGTLGNTAFYSGEKVILGKSACFFNLSSALSKHYVRTVLQTPRFLNYLHKTATGSTIKNVPLQAMRNFSFGIPPIAEQHQIVDEVEARTAAIDHLEAELDRQITRSKRLRQSTLESAFAGTLS